MVGVVRGLFAGPVGCASRAFLWTAGGGMQFLDDLAASGFQGWRFTGVSSIANTGYVAATGVNPAVYDGSVQTVLLQVTAVPEPGTWALLGTGLLALGGVAARRRRRPA